MKIQLILSSLIAAVAVACNVQPRKSAAANPEAKRIAAGTAPVSLALADFNDDGKLELALGDLNGDGKADIVVANLEGNDVLIILAESVTSSA